MKLNLHTQLLVSQINHPDGDDSQAVMTLPGPSHPRVT